MDITAQLFDEQLVTGCSSGIGRALANELLSRNCIVYATARNTSTLADLASKGAYCLQLDVLSENSCSQAIGKVIADQGRIDILINNAGAGGLGPLLEYGIDDALLTFQTNTLAPLRLAQLAGVHMVKARTGIIVNIGSVVGELGPAWAGIYNASKAALHSWSKTLEMELAPFNVKVLLIVTGGIQSSFGANQLRSYNPVENSLYASLKEMILKRGDAGQDGALPAEVYARKVAAQILMKTPVKSLWIGTRASQFYIFTFLPWLVPRWVFMRFAGLLTFKA